MRIIARHEKVRGGLLGIVRGTLELVSKHSEAFEVLLEPDSLLTVRASYDGISIRYAIQTSSKNTIASKHGRSR